MSKRKPSGVFSFMVPVFVTVVCGRVTDVNVADETTPTPANSRHIEGAKLEKLIAASLNDEDWPAWEFGW